MALGAYNLDAAGASSAVDLKFAAAGTGLFSRPTDGLVLRFQVCGLKAQF